MTATVSYHDKRHPLLRAFNWSGSFLRGVNLPWTSLDETKLMAAARRWAGYDDFGPDHFLEPLRVLLHAARNEAPLTYMGQIVARVVTLFGLITRLSMQRETAEHPEIREQPVRRPLIVVGAPRTGTTLLHHLLSLDPGARPLIAWEALTPAPMGFGRRRFDFRPLIAAYTVGMNKGVLAPESAGMHKYSYNGQAECTTLLWPSFVFPVTMVLPSVHEWLMKADDSVYDNAYGMYRLALQMLHWQRPASDHWVLKSPQHIWAMDALARAVPEATIVHTHRSMNEVLPSFCSLSAVLLSMWTNDLEPGKMGPAAMKLAGENLDRLKKARTRIDASRVTDVRYPDLVADPIGTIRRIYRDHDYDFTAEFESRMRRWLERDQESGRPKHVYSHERFGLDRDQITEAFAEYHHTYGVEG